jgi:hypothetical protein
VRVKMKKTAAGPVGVFQAGQEVVVSDELGKSFVEGGYAVEVKVSPPAAKASKPKSKKRGRRKATQKPPETATIPEADEA